VPVAWLIVLTHALIARDLLSPTRHRRWWMSVRSSHRLRNGQSDVWHLSCQRHL
jgi:hypothetical protein